MIFKTVLSMFLVVEVLARYAILLENVTVEYVDHNYLEVTGEVYKFNETTNALQGSVIIKKSIPNASKILFKAYRLINKDYRFMSMQVVKTSSQMDGNVDIFDIRNLFLDYTRPPVTFPLQIGVTYRTVNWSPDSSKYPQYVPIGKWKINGQALLPDKKEICNINWFAKLY